MPRPMITVLLVLLTASVIFAADDTYRAELEKDRRDTDDMLRSARSPLLLVGRFKVNEGSSRVGSDPACTIVLPPKAPAHVGTLTRRGSVISFEPAPGTSVYLNDKPISANVMLQVAESPKPTDRIGFGDFKFGVRSLNNGFTLLLSDTQSPYLKSFSGTRWFAIDPTYRVTAQFVPSSKT